MDYFIRNIVAESLGGWADAQVELLFRFAVACNMASVQESVLVSSLGQRNYQPIGNPLDSPGIDFGIGQ